jgi:membrane fusion protein, multidrug efflux system
MTEPHGTITMSIIKEALPEQRPPNQVKASLFIAAMAIGVLLFAGFLYFLRSHHYQTTADAQVDGYILPVAPRIDGTIRDVYVDDGVYVNAGQPLVDLDPADNEARLADLKAKYEEARAEISAQHPNLPAPQLNAAIETSVQEAAVANARVALASAQHDLNRAMAILAEAKAHNGRAQADHQPYELLYSKKQVARVDYDAYATKAAAQNALIQADEELVASANKNIEEREADLAREEAQLAQLRKDAPRQITFQAEKIGMLSANAASLAAQLNQAELNLQDCRLSAPLSGIIVEQNAEIGSRITVGQPLMMIVEVDNLWVTANYDKRQLARMHAGQHVTIHVDALGKDIRGTVESIPATVEHVAEVPPPEDAAGRHGKVVAHWPVRIRFDAGQPEILRLRPGMSVKASVRV